jgi:hypothetical protein
MHQLLHATEKNIMSKPITSFQERIMKQKVHRGVRHCTSLSDKFLVDVASKVIPTIPSI